MDGLLKGTCRRNIRRYMPEIMPIRQKKITIQLINPRSTKCPLLEIYPMDHVHVVYKCIMHTSFAYFSEIMRPYLYNFKTKQLKSISYIYHLCHF